MSVLVVMLVVTLGLASVSLVAILVSLTAEEYRERRRRRLRDQMHEATAQRIEERSAIVAASITETDSCLARLRGSMREDN